jgi:hypothetical protein
MELDHTVKREKGPFRDRWVYDGKATARFVYPDGTQLHTVSKNVGLSNELGLNTTINPSVFVGLRVPMTGVSLAQFAKTADIRYLGVERVEGVDCQAIELRNAADGGELIIQVASDPTSQHLPRRLSILRELDGKPWVEWRILIKSVQDVKDAMTQDVCPFPQRVTVEQLRQGERGSETEFEVQDVSINSVFADSKFSTDLSALPEGVMVSDSVAFPDGKSRVTAGNSDAFSKRNKELFPEFHETNRKTPVVAQVPNRWPVFVSAGLILSLTLVGLGLYLRRRQ